ncbi:MAG: response regulator transcription factor [Parvularculaceae bacterium]|nr:response regulator transcription factor [Parvularculaceae bacterium]
MKLMIVDDEPLAVRRLEITLGAIAGAECVATARNCEEAVRKFRESAPDIVLLDICMKNGDGFDFLEMLPADAAPGIIFVTAFDHFAARAFDVLAADYVLKPVEPDRLKLAIERARVFLQAHDADNRICALRETVAQLREEIRKTHSDYDKEIWVNGAAGAHIRVPVDDIVFARSEGEYVRIHTKFRSHLIRISLLQLEERLDPAEFIRTHRSAIVRLSAIESFGAKASGGGEVRLRDGATVPLGRVYAKRIRTIAASRSSPVGRAESFSDKNSTPDRN